MEPANHPYIPDEAFLYFPPPNEIKNGSIRLIFDGGVPYDADERSKLQQFQAYLNGKKLTLEPYWQDNTRLKFLQANGFDFDKTVAAMADYMNWKTTKLVVQEQPVLRKHLERGMMYFCGRDCNYKPVIVLDVKKIIDSSITTEDLVRLMGFFFNFVVETMMIEGQVENWVIIIDLNKVGVTGAMSVLFPTTQTMKESIKFLSNSFRQRLKSTYMVNCPGLISFAWKAAKAFLDEQTIKKVSLYDDSFPKPIVDHVNKSQFERKYGGNMPNITDYWPPKHRSLEFQVGNSKSHLVSKEDYRKMYETGQLKNRKICASFVATKPVPSTKVATELSSQPTFGHLANSAQREPLHREHSSRQGNQQSQVPPSLGLPPQHNLALPSQTSGVQIPSINANIAQQSDFRTSSHQMSSIAIMPSHSGMPQTYSPPPPPQNIQAPPPPQVMQLPSLGQIPHNQDPSAMARSNLAHVSSTSVIHSLESIPNSVMPGQPQPSIFAKNPQIIPPPSVQISPRIGTHLQGSPEQIIRSSMARKENWMPPPSYSKHSVFSFDMEADEGCALPVQPTRLFLKPKNFNSLT